MGLLYKCSKMERKEDIKMEKINEVYIKTCNDWESISWIQKYMKQYPTEKGFRVECFLSPKFIRITIYE